jgi:hypothetical protein
MSDNGYISATALLDMARMDVEVEGGRRYQIRKIGPAELASLGGNIDLSAVSDELKEGARREKRLDREKLDERQAEVFAYQERVVSAGVSSLRIVRGDVVPGREDEIHIRDVPLDDQLQLFAKILAFSGLSKEEAAKVVPS